MEEISQIFRNNMDEIVLDLASHDPELADGIRWLDYEGRKQGLDFYQMCKIIMKRHDANTKAKLWLKNKCMNN